MHNLFIVILFLLRGGVQAFNLTEYAGGSIIIKCNYTNEQTGVPKHFCREGKNITCDEQIRSNVSNLWWQTNGRFSLYDKTDKGFFKVTLRNLTHSDSGKYWCGANERKIKGTEINLNVVEGKRNSRHELGYTGKNISIKCHYDLEKYKNDFKYMCRTEAVGCTDRIRTHVSNKWVTSDKLFKGKERFSLYDNTTAGFFIVSITNLTPEDAGTYWCGVHASFQKNSNLSVDNLTDVILNVKNDGSNGGIIPVIASLGAVALVFGAGFFICLHCRRSSRKGVATSSSLEGCNKPESGHKDCEYEEIQGPAHSLNQAGTDVNTVYSTILSDNYTYTPVELPTIQSGDGTYSMVQLPTMQPDDATYSMAQLPIMQTDDATYFNAQLPAMQSCKTA